MLKRFMLWVCLLVPMGVQAAVAQDLAVVSQMRMPVWLERDGLRTPLQPGQALQAGDALLTGSQARVYLQMAEGSTVKLGADAHFRVAALEARGDELSAALEVARGAFRFTTAAIDKVLRKRDVRIRVAALTAGIRGTDIWGRSDDAADFVCLLEGRIGVSHADGTVASMNEPLTFFRASRGSGPEPIQAVAPEQVQTWAEETEIAEHSGAAATGGRWRLVLGSFRREAGAATLLRQARDGGYAASVRPRPVAPGVMYQVVIAGFASRDDARAAALSVERDVGVKPLVTR